MAHLILLKKFDLNGVLEDFQSGACPDQDEVRKQLTESMRSNKRWFSFLHDIAMKTVGEGMKPVDMIAFMSQVCLTLGVMLERERLRRKGIAIPE